MSLLTGRPDPTIFRYFKFLLPFKTSHFAVRAHFRTKMITSGTVSRVAARASLTVAFILGFATVSPASDTLTRGALPDAARAFEDAALRVNDAQPAEPVRWTRPIFLAVADAGGMRALAPEIEASVKYMAAIARVSVTRVDINDPRRNFVVRQADPAGRAACRAGIYSQAGHITSVDVEIWLGGRGSLSRCINHEVMHGFGFRSHAHAAVSILSYKQARQTQLSAIDRVLLETLYDARIQPGMNLAAAAATSCGIIAEKLGVPAREAAGHCGQAPMPRQVATTTFGRRGRQD